MPTITGNIRDQFGSAAPVGDVTLTPANDGHVISNGGNVELGSLSYSIADLPDPITLEAGVWRVVVRSAGRVNNQPIFPPQVFTIDLTSVSTVSWAGIYEGVAAFQPGTIDTTDQAIAAKIDDPASATSATLSATYVRGPRSADDPDFRQFAVAMHHQFTSLGNAQGVLKDYKAWGYETIFYSQMMDYLATGDATGIPEKPLVITVDDGGASNYTNLYPALQEFGMKATYFIVPHWVNGTISTPPNGGVFQEASAFTWTQAREMFASGLVDFESHTLTHGSMRALTGAGTFTADLSADGSGAGADFEAAKSMIEANVPGCIVEYNACPYGVINEAAIASLQASSCKGNRITQCGRNLLGEYDGSGSLAFTLFSTDPYRVPIADIGNMKSLRRANVYGTADPDGNRVQNGRFLVTARGFTLPTGWSHVSDTLPEGASPATGNVLRGFGTAAATGAYHTDLIPVGYWATYSLDWYIKATLAGASSARLAVDCYDTPTGALVKTIADPPGQQATDTSSWIPKRWTIWGDGTYQWVRLRFEVVGATASSEMKVWDVRLRAQKNMLDSGSPRAV